jgi:hypothetical protein
VLIKLFFKSCASTIDLIQTKLEFEKSNADNSAETKMKTIDAKGDQLRQISIDHQIMFLNIAIRLFE